MNDNLLLKTLRIRPFFYLMLSEFFSQFSMNLFNFALLIIVFSVANSNTAVSGVVMAFTIPNILFGILAGVLVDRWDKKKVLYLTNIIRAILILPLVFFYNNLALVYLFTFIFSTVTQFFIPAETPIIPLLVKKKLLLSANAMFGMGIYASMFAAYALSGPLIIFFGKSNIFVFLTITLMLAGLSAYLIKVKNYKEKQDVNDVEILSFREELTFVINLIVKTKNLFHSLFSLTLSQIIVLVFAVIGPGYAERVLNIKVESFPILFVTPSIIGVTLGALIIGNFFHNRSRSLLTKFGLFLMGIAIILLPYGSRFESREIVQTINMYLPYLVRINTLHILVFLAFVFGFAISFVFIPANTVLQEETSDEARGKIYGVLNTLVGITSIIPVVLVGGLSDVFGVKAVITWVGITVLIIAFFRTFIWDRK